MTDARSRRTLPRVLVIDDDEGVRAALETMLNEAGLDVLMARDGRQGVELFLAHSVDMVITDMSMPLKGGNETIFEIRRRNPHVPIIAMSGRRPAAKDNLKTAAGKNGADRIIGKPFDCDELYALVGDLLPRWFDASAGRGAGGGR
jgi:DNA-binding response OmpR family regulator